MVADVLSATKDWEYDAISIGYPGPVGHDRPLAEPHNLASGWVGFPYQNAFPKPIRFINDAAMQALGGYTGGKMLFLGIGTGLGSALIVDERRRPARARPPPLPKARHLRGVHRPRRSRAPRQKTLARLRPRRRRPPPCRLRRRLRPPRRRQRQAHEDTPEGVQLGANSNAIAGGIALWQQPAAAATQSGSALTRSDTRGPSQNLDAAALQPAHRPKSKRSKVVASPAKRLPQGKSSSGKSATGRKRRSS